VTNNIAAFSPIDLSPLVWLKADVGTFEDTARTVAAADDGDAVKGWEDQSGNGKHASEATNAPALKLVIQNSNSVLRFDGSNDILTSTVNGTALTAVTCAFVLAPKDTGTTTGLIQWGNIAVLTQPFILVQRNVGDIRVYVNGGYQFTVAISANVFHSYILTWDGTTWNLYVDGVAQTPYVGGAGVDQTQALTILFGNGYNGFAAVDHAEFFALNNVPSAGNRASIVSYFQTSWGTP